MCKQNTHLHIRSSVEEKEAFQELVARYGLTTSAALRWIIQRSLQENRLPFGFGDPVLNANSDPNGQQ